MTPAQLRALHYHCRFAFETAHPKLAWLTRDASCTVIVSVNTGYE